MLNSSFNLSFEARATFNQEALVQRLISEEVWEITVENKNLLKQIVFRERCMKKKVKKTNKC